MNQDLNSIKNRPAHRRSKSHKPKNIRISEPMTFREVKLNMDLFPDHASRIDKPEMSSRASNASIVIGFKRSIGG